ncbi:MAG: DUF3429 domain-containing protein [Pseudomonadota bacterium]|nr:DUF3429 domain-containing protein [Pseudomonadota bacterium]
MNRLILAFAIVAVMPFVVLSTSVPLRLFPYSSAVVEVLLTYAAVVISFLGGIHWGVAVTQYAAKRNIAHMLIAEGVWPSLVAWGVLFFGDTYTKLLVLTLLYTFVWTIDSLLYNNDMIPQWFFNVRCIVTPIVVVSLYVAYFGLI